MARLSRAVVTLISFALSVSELTVLLHSQQSLDSNAREALYALADRMNGLYGDDMKPWHLKIRYKLLDPSGLKTDGTIEEIWVAPHKRRVTIQDQTSSLTDIETEKGNYRDGDLNQRLALLQHLERSFVRPMLFAARTTKKSPDLSFQNRQIGTSQLRCFTISVTTFMPGTVNDPTSCVALNEPIVRICSFLDDPHQFMRNHIGKFQGRYVPVDVAAGSGEKPDVTAHLDQLETLTQVDPAAFNPGPNARLIHPARITIVIPEAQLDSARPHLLRVVDRPQPEYPAEAQAAGVHGTVEMRALIGTDGRIAALHVFKGSPMLQQAALEAVWRWRFEPPFANEGPAQILTVLAVHF